MWEGIYSPRRVSYPCPAAATCPPPSPPPAHVPVGNSFSSFTVLTAGPLSRLLGAFWLLPLIPGECWQPKVSVSSSECRWGGGGEYHSWRPLTPGSADGVRLWKEWQRWVLFLAREPWGPQDTLPTHDQSQVSFSTLRFPSPLPWVGVLRTAL